MYKVSSGEEDSVAVSAEENVLSDELSEGGIGSKGVLVDVGGGVTESDGSGEGGDGSLLYDVELPEKPEKREDNKSGDRPPSMEKRSKELVPEVSDVVPPKPLELPIPENSIGRMSLYA